MFKANVALQKKNPVSLFNGTTLNKSFCKRKCHDSQAHSPLAELSFILKGDDDLQALVTESQKAFQLDGTRKCQECSYPAMKQDTLIEFPRYLFVILKRMTENGKKIHSKIVPKESLSFNKISYRFLSVVVWTFVRFTHHADRSRSPKETPWIPATTTPL